VADGLGGELAFLADRHETGAKEVRDGGADDEAARLDRRDLGDPLAPIALVRRYSDRLCCWVPEYGATIDLAAESDASESRLQ
jgi:hypothetical protein